MIYNNYVNKIKKLAKIKSTILRFKIAIISAFVLILGFTVFYNSCKGIVSGDIIVPESIYYGDEYNANGLKGFMSDITYEYSADGRSWGIEKPEIPGEYYVRGASKKTFNRNSYSKTAKFTILPTPTTLSITSNVIRYGDLVDYEIDLVNDDYVEYVDFIYEDISSSVTNIMGNKDTLVIKDSEGNDVTNYYSIETPEKEVEIDKRNINISINKVQKVYDGKPLTNITYEKNGLAFNDTFSASINVYKDDEIIYPILSGTYEARLDNSTINILNNGIDVTGQYNVILSNSTVEIAKRPITIKTQDLTKEYDSTSLESNLYSITKGSLAEGDELVILSSNSSITNVGTTQNVIEFDIINENGESVYSSYEVNIIYGTLEVTPCVIDVTTKSSERVYTSHELYNKEYTLSKPLFGSDAIIVSYYPTITNVGIIDNILLLEVEGSRNYKFNYTYGTLKVIPRDVEVIPDNQSKEYDGLELSASTFTQRGLVSSHKIRISSIGITDVGSLEVSIDVAIYDIDGNDVTNNYNVIASNLMLEIYKRNVTIDACNDSTIYNGLEYKYNASSYEVVSGYFNNIDSFEIAVSFNESPINAGSYSFSISNAYVVDDTKAKNYEITLSNNIHTLIIYKRDVELSLSINNVNYDANIHNEFEYSIMRGSFVGSDRINNLYVDFYNENNELVDPKDAGIYYAKLSSIEIDGNINNYNIIVSNVYFEIIKRQIIIAPQDLEITYGDELSYSGLSFIITNDCQNTELNYDNIILYVSYYSGYNPVTPINVGKYTIRIDGVEGITDNYSVGFNDATLTINKATINIELSKEYLNLNNSSYHIYDGLEVIYNKIYNNFTVISGELKYSDSLMVYPVIKINNVITHAVDVGTYSVSITGYEAYNGYYNYNVILNEELPFDIEKRTINFYMNDATYEYDGTSKTLELYTDIPFVDGDKFESKITYYNASGNVVIPAFAGQYLGVATFSKAISGDINNYNLVYDNAYAVLTINKRVVKIKIRDFSYSYNKKSFDEQGYTTIYDIVENSMVSNHGLFINYIIYDKDRNISSATNVGEYTIEFVDYEITRSLKENYEIICENGTIKVTKAIINIKPIDMKITYGDSYTYGNQDYDNIESLYDSLAIVIDEEDLAYINAGIYNITIKEYYLENSDNYEVTIEEGILTINKLSINISLKEAYESKVYDGIKYEYLSELGNYNSDIELPYNDLLSLNILFNSSEYALDANSYTVKLKSYIDQNNYTGNYNITFETQRFTISKRDVIVSPLDNYTKYYDGLEFTYSNDTHNYVIEGDYDIVSGDEIKIGVLFYKDGILATPINPGIYDIVVDSYEFISGKRTNYNIIYGSNKTLEIYNSVITVRLDFSNVLDSIIYDGNYHAYDVSYEVIDVVGINIEDVPELILNIVYVDELGNVYTSIKNVGKYQVLCDSIYCLDVLEFEIIIEEYVSPITIINQKDLTVKFNDIYETYDGQIHNSFIVDAISNEFVSGENAVLNVSTNEDAVNTGIYDLKIASIEFINGYEENYNISLDYIGVLEILKRDIQIKPNDKNKTYDGIEFVYDGSYKALEYDVVGSDTLEIQVKYLKDNADIAPINAGKYNIVITGHILYGDENNYNITYLNNNYYPAYLTIYRRDVFITPNNIDSFTYDADIYEYQEYLGNYTTQTGLLDNVRVTIKPRYYVEGISVVPKNVGSYDVYFDAIDIENDILANYNILITPISFEIEKRKLTISSNQEFINQVYGFDGYTYDSSYSENFIITSGTLDEGLLHNDELTIHVNFVDGLNNIYEKAINASNYTLALSYYETINSINDSNYDITFEDDTAFTISPRSLNLKPIDCEWIYDGSYYLYDSTKFIDTLDNNLVFEDSLEVSVVYKDLLGNVAYPIYASTYNIYINGYTFINGLASNYDITYSSDLVYLTILKRDITLTPAINNKEYDGIEIVLYEYSYVASQIFDDLRVTEYNVNADRILDARDYHISIVSYEFDSDDILNSYNITLIDKDITITQRGIIIILNTSYQKNYDQEAYDLSTISYRLSKQLVNNDTLNISFETYLNGVETEAKNAGTYVLKIKSAYVNSNYVFDITDESIININKANLYVTPFSQDSFKYDNSIISYPEYYGNYENVTGLFDGLSLMISVKYKNTKTNTSYSSVKDAGVYTLIPSINDIDGDLIDNFNITYPTIKFEIYRREITISSVTPLDKEYDGITLYSKDYTEYSIISGDAVLDVDTISLDIRFNNATSAKNANTYTTKLSKYILNGNSYLLSDMTNYSITYIPTSFTISKRVLIIDLLEENYVYDGAVKKYSNAYNNFNVVDGSLIDGENIKISVSYFDESYTSIAEVINPGTYYIKYNSFTVKNSLTSNYDISTTKEYYSFTVLQKTLVIKPATMDSVMYDGKAYTHNGAYEIVENYNVSDEEISSLKLSFNFIDQNNNKYTSVVNAGIYTIKLKSSNLNDIYVVQSDDVVTFEITKRTVIVNPISVESTYNGDEYIYDSTKYSLDLDNGYSLVSGSLNIEVSYYQNSLLVDPINVGLYDIVVIGVTYSGDINNYEFILGKKEDALEIIKADIEISPSNCNTVYNGEVYIYDTSNYSLNGSLYNDDNIEIEIGYSSSNSEFIEVNPINAGTYYIYITGYSFIGDENNYNITIINPAILTIEKETINIKLNQSFNNKTYDGISYKYDKNIGFSVINGTIYNNDEILLDIVFNGQAEVVDVGNYVVGLKGYSVNGNSNINEVNYKLELEEIEFEIYKKDVFVELLDLTNHTYNGQAYTYSNDDYNYKSCGELVGSDELLKIYVKFYQNDVEVTAKNVGSYNVKAYSYEMSVGNINNYNFISGTTTLIIEKASIGISLKNQVKEYTNEVFKYPNDYTLEYGEIYESNILDLSNYEYEYLVDSISIEPINVGTYIVKLKSEIVLDNYLVEIVNDTASLEITKKKVTITLNDQTIEYDGKIYNNYPLDDYLVDELAKGDALEITVLYTSDINGLVEVNPVNAGTYYIHLKSHNLDLNNYEVSYKYSRLVIEKRKVSITPKDIEDFEFDGSTYVYESVFGNYQSQSGLLEGVLVKLEASYNKEPRNVGIYNATFKVIEIENDILNNYEFNISNVEFEILPRNITIETSSKVFDYDGSSHSSRGFSIISGSLPTGFNIVVKNDTSVVNAGVYENKIEVIISSTNYADETDNFNISYEYGTITINQRSITIKSSTATYVFNNKNQVLKEFTITSGSLVEGDTVVALAAIDCIYAGVYENKLDYLIINSLSEDVTDNYDITKEYGIITIEKLVVEYYVSNVSEIYSGKEYNYTYKYLEGKTSNDTKYRSIIRFDITVYNGETESSLLNLGVYRIIISNITTSTQADSNSIEVLLYDESDNLTNELEFTITRKEITVETNSAYKIYDGKELSCDSFTNSSIISGHNITADLSTLTTITDGNIENRFNVIITDSDGIDVTNNYEIIYTYGKLSVTKDIYFNIESSIEYTGENIIENINKVAIYDNETNTIISNAYCSITEISFYKNNILVAPINIGEYQYVINAFEIYQDNELISTDNLNIHNLLEGNFEITKRNITITIEDVTKTYDGTSKKSNQFTITSGSLIEGHKLSIETTGSIVNVGTVKNGLSSYTIVDSLGNDVSEYYNLNAIDGTIRIVVRYVYVNTFGGEKTYDGRALVVDEFEIFISTEENTGLLQGFRVEIKASYTKAINCGEYLNRITFKVVDEEGNTSTNYRVIINELGILKINKIKLQITTASESKEYDGNSLTANSYEITNGSLPEGYLIEIVYSGVQTEVGMSYNEISSIVIKNSLGEDVTDNFEIEKIYGILEVY